MNDHITIKQKYERLLENIDKAARKVGKTKDDITIVVAGKYASVAQLTEVIEAGATIIGENRATDLLKHQSSIHNSQLEWHFIGHLQTNKINKIVGKINMLQSLDSFHLVESINKYLRADVSHYPPLHPVPTLIEINIARDPNKFGIQPNELESFLSQFVDLNQDQGIYTPYLSPQGLMTVGKVWESEKEARLHFSHMRKLLERFNQLTSQPVNQSPILSMGMSGDYQWAIQEGATMIRVGSALFNTN